MKNGQPLGIDMSAPRLRAPRGGGNPEGSRHLNLSSILNTGRFPHERVIMFLILQNFQFLSNMKYRMICFGLLMTLVVLSAGCMTTQPNQVAPATQVSSPITNGIVNPLLAHTSIPREDPIIGQWYMHTIGWTTGMVPPGEMFFSFRSSGNYQTTRTYDICNLEKGCYDSRTDIQSGVWKANGNNTYILSNQSSPLVFSPENDTLTWSRPEILGYLTNKVIFYRYRANDPIIGQWVPPLKSGDSHIIYYFKLSGRYNSSYTRYPASGDPISIQKYGIWKSIGDNKYALSDLSGLGESPDPFVYFPENDTIARDGITLNRPFQDGPAPHLW